MGKSGKTTDVHGSSPTGKPPRPTGSHARSEPRGAAQSEHLSKARKQLENLDRMAIETDYYGWIGVKIFYEAGRSQRIGKLLDGTEK